MRNCLKCQKPIPNFIKINSIRKNLQNRKFCLECSPFGKHNTRDISNINEPEGFHTCPKCKQLLINTEFFASHSWCRKCISNQTIDRQREFKQRCIDYKGGCCCICKYNKTNSALEFHHKDKSKKDFNISYYKLVSIKNNFEIVQKELDKCLLVCANCHREIHAGLVDISQFCDMLNKQEI